MSDVTTGEKINIAVIYRNYQLINFPLALEKYKRQTASEDSSLFSHTMSTIKIMYRPQ